MARRLPTKRSKQHQLIIDATYDYYGASPDRHKSAVKVSLDEKFDVAVIRENLSDKVYVATFSESPTKNHH